MFTQDDRDFLDRLGRRAQIRLATTDPSIDRLHAAIEGLRGVLRDQRSVDDSRRAELDELLDLIWWASSAGDSGVARERAAALAHGVRRLSLDGVRSMTMVDAAQQIRTLVVLAA
jgi:hypothetical protein